MENGDSLFPLLNLPDGPLKCVLQNMELFQQMNFSTLSKKSKELVKSLTLDVRRITVYIDRDIIIDVEGQHESHFGLFFDTEQSHDGRNYIPVTDTSDVFDVLNYDGRQTAFKWKGGFGVKYWIYHILSVCNRSKADILSFSGEDLFDVKSIAKTISDATKINIENAYPAAYIQQIVQAFPYTKQLNFCGDILGNSGDVHRITCQDFDIFSVIYIDQIDLQSWKLDDLLVMKSRSIRLQYSNLTEKEFNRFLRHWMNGSNPRMEHMAIRFPDIQNPSKDIILNGLNHKIVPSEQERPLKRPIEDFYRDRTDIVRGGYDIQRKDGTTATIVFHQYHQRRRYHLEVFVWH